MIDLEALNRALSQGRGFGVYWQGDERPGFPAHGFRRIKEVAHALD